MASEDVPAKSRLTGFVRAVADLLPDALNGAMVIEEDAQEEATIREIVAEYLGGKIADDKDAAVALVDALDVLEGGLAPDRAPHLKEGKLGAAIIKLVEERRAALVALNKIHALTKGRNAATLDVELPPSVSPATVLVDVHEALTNAALGRGWSGQRGVA